MSNLSNASEAKKTTNDPKDQTNNHSGLVYNHYICRVCGAEGTDDPDCSSCGNTMCVMLQQWELESSSEDDEEEEIPEECLGCETGAECDGAHRLENGDFHPNCCTRAAEAERAKRGEDWKSLCCA